MFYDNEAWQKVREEALALARERNEDIIENWLAQIGYTEPVGYYRNIVTHEMKIYTTRPGVLIGKAGVSVHAFEKMLSEEFGGEWKVKFHEIRGGWANLGGKHGEASNQ